MRANIVADDVAVSVVYVRDQVNALSNKLPVQAVSASNIASPSTTLIAGYTIDSY